MVNEVYCAKAPWFMYNIQADPQHEATSKTVQKHDTNTS